MSTVKHTLGPWNCMRASAGGRDIITSEVTPLDVCVLSKSNKSAVEIEANAHLIAAAPELLEACKAIVAYDEDNESGSMAMVSLYNEAITQARAAIAKAEGNV